MNSTIASPLIQPVKKQKNMLFIIPAIIMVVYVVLNALDTIKWLFEIGDSFQSWYGREAADLNAWDEYLAYTATVYIWNIAFLVTVLLGLFFVFACLKKANEKNYKKFIFVFFIQAAVYNLFEIIINVINDLAYKEMCDILYASETWHTSSGVFDEWFWKNLFIYNIPLIIWYVLLFVSETKENKNLRTISLVFNALGILGCVISAIQDFKMYFFDIAGFFNDLGNNIEWALQSIFNILWDFLLLVLFYIAILIYQIAHLRKPKEKKAVANHVPTSQPARPVVPVQPVRPAVQPVIPVVPVQPIYQPVVPVQPVRPVTPVQPVPPAPATQQSAEERLLSLKKLFDSNAITQEEYDKKREEILKDF